MRKTVICLLITAVLVFGMLTGTVSAAWAGSRSGITWEMQGTTLVISGSGEIEDYSGVKAPWEGKKNVATSLVIRTGITSIGASAFSGFSSMGQ